MDRRNESEMADSGMRRIHRTSESPRRVEGEQVGHRARSASVPIGPSDRKASGATELLVS